MKIKKKINLGIISRSNTKYSLNCHYKNYMVEGYENYKLDLELKS